MPNEPISRYTLAKTLGYLHKDIMVPALEGIPAYYRSITTSNPEEIRKISNSDSRDVLDAISAMQALSSIGVMPLYSKSPLKHRISGSFSPVANANLSVRPEQYQIMSLTLDDFQKGVVLNPKGEVQSVYDERPRGTSINKMIQASGYTRALG